MWCFSSCVYPRDLEDLHTVFQRRGNRVQLVGGGQKQDFGQVEWNLEIVIRERVILFRVQHFEERRRRIAPEVVRELVDLVENDDRIAGAGLLEALNDPAGKAPT